MLSGGFLGLEGELIGRDCGQTGLDRDEAWGTFERQAAELIGTGQAGQVSQTKVLEKRLSRDIRHGAARGIDAAGWLNQAAFEEGLHDSVDGHAADQLDFGACDWLAISYDGQRLKGGLREAGRPEAFACQSAEPGRVIGECGELPSAGDTD